MMRTPRTDMSNRKGRAEEIGHDKDRGQSKDEIIVFAHGRCLTAIAAAMIMDSRSARQTPLSPRPAQRGEGGRAKRGRERGDSVFVIFVMPGLVPGIHVLLATTKTWIAETSPAMTSESNDHLPLLLPQP